MSDIPQQEAVEPEVPVTDDETSQVNDEVVEKDPKEKVVPHGAFHEERERRKAAQRQLDEEKRSREQERQVFNRRLDELYAIARPQQQQPQVDPNDPLAVHDHALKEQAKALAQVQQRQQWEDAQKQQAAQTQQLASWASSQANEFMAEAPDYSDAYKHMVNLRGSELKAMGLGPAEIQRAIMQDELAISAHAHQTGKNPAQIIYEMAKNTGFKKSGAQKMEALQGGVKASQALKGGGVSGKPTPEQIANMTDEQFSKFKQELSKSGQRVSDLM